MTKYTDILISLIKKADRVNKNIIDKVSSLIALTIKNDGIIYMFGCGHSMLIAEDCFYRAGGLSNIQPMFVEQLMLHESASLSSTLEKDEKNIGDIFSEYSISDKDLLFVFSVSGINGVPVEVAKMGKEKNLTVIGMGSSSYDKEESRHSSNKHLKDYCDYYIDNCVPKGDSVLKMKDGRIAISVSTSISSFLIQNCLYNAFIKCEKEDINVPFFGSGNLKENKERNALLVEKFKQRIKHL